MTPSCYRSPTGNVRADMTMWNAEVVIVRRLNIIRLRLSALYIRASCNVESLCRMHCNVLHGLHRFLWTRYILEYLHYRK